MRALEKMTYGDYMTLLQQAGEEHMAANIRRSLNDRLGQPVADNGMFILHVREEFHLSWLAVAMGFEP